MIHDIQKFLEVEKNDADVIMVSKWVGHYKTFLQKYKFDDRNQKMFEQVAHYFALRHAKREGFTNLSAGLLLFGGVGTGKTHAMRLLSSHFGIEFVEAQELAVQYAIGGDKGFSEWVADWKYKELIIDDIGAEREVKHFGNAGIVGEFIGQRYNLWTLEGKLTHMTSNLSEEDFIDRYGERTWSRLHEMCGFVSCVGKDARRTETP